MLTILLLMHFSEFISKTAHFKSKKLGGVDAQFKFAPSMRLQYNKTQIKALQPKKAAVLALFFPNKNHQASFLLTLRASYKGVHSAQVSFPGGKTDKRDKNLTQTALRETFEEVGIPKTDITILKQMTNAFIPPSNFLVTPFLGYTTKTPSYTINHEVETVIEVLVKDLLNENNITTTKINNSYMTNVSVPCLKLNNYIIWGATAMMLSEIRELLL